MNRQRQAAVEELLRIKAQLCEAADWLADCDQVRAAAMLLAAQRSILACCYLISRRHCSNSSMYSSIASITAAGAAEPCTRRFNRVPRLFPGRDELQVSEVQAVPLSAGLRVRPKVLARRSPVRVPGKHARGVMATPLWRRHLLLGGIVTSDLADLAVARVDQGWAKLVARGCKRGCHVFTARQCQDHFAATDDRRRDPLPALWWVARGPIPNARI